MNLGAEQRDGAVRVGDRARGGGDHKEAMRFRGRGRARKRLGAPLLAKELSEWWRQGAGVRASGGAGAGAGGARVAPGRGAEPDGAEQGRDAPLMKAADLDPAHTPTRRLLAGAMLRAGRADEAVSTYTAAEAGAA